MVRIDKQHIGNLLLVELLSEKNRYLNSIRHYEKKYNASVSDFEEALAKSKKEDFEAWDDLVDWQANQSLLLKTEAQIEDIRNGNIEVAD
jgi:hypothetical protein